MNKPTLIMTVGLPASGKSTYAEKKRQEGWIIHSSDMLREEMFNNVDEQKHNNELFDELHRRIITDLEKGFNVIYDATNLKMKTRKNFLFMIRKMNVYKKAVVFAIPYETCLENNKKRKRKVPQHVMFSMLKSFCPVVYQEGWDEIEFEISQYETVYPKFFFNQMSNFNQDNPNHSLTLLQHCESAKKYLENKLGFESLLRIVGLYHDIGKLKTKEVDENGIVHYYSHENVGSYMIMFVLGKSSFKKEKLVDMLIHMQTLIYLHMRPFNSWQQSQKAYNKDLTFFGEDIIKEVELLHEADKQAH